MKNVLVIFFFLISISTSAQPSVTYPKIFTTVTDKLKGKVKQVAEITYKTDNAKSFNDTVVFNYDEAGYLIAYENKYYSFVNSEVGPQLDKCIYKYDKNHNIIKKSFYNKNILRETAKWKYDKKNKITEHSILDGSKERFRKKMEYNNLDKLMKTEVFRYQEKEPDAITEYKYENGNAVLTISKYKNYGYIDGGEEYGEEKYRIDTIKSKYDSLGNEIRIEEYNDIREVTRVIINKYNDKNQRTRSEHWKNDTMQSAWEWRFDSLGRVEERKQFDSENKLINHEQWFVEGNKETKISKYHDRDTDSLTIEKICWITDNFGNEIEYSRQEDERIIFHIKTEYKYDKNSNWIEKLEYNAGDKTAFRRTKREIVYLK